MAIRSLNYRGFGLSVRVPDGALPATMRRVLGRASSRPQNGAAGEGPALGDAGAIQVRKPPAVSARRRDPLTASAFLTRFYEESGGARAEERERLELSLADQVASTGWYHTIELGEGVVTPGLTDHRPLVPHYGIPDSLAGLRCLDAACSNGFWTFEFERRGGEVVALDLPSYAELDFPVGTPPMAAERSDELAATAFDIAHRALGSKAKLVRRSVYSMDPADLGTFDFVHIADVLLHLRNPLEALTRLRGMLAPGGSALIAEVFDPGLLGTVTEYRGGFDGVVWWHPSLDCLVQMIYDAGFSTAEVQSVYRPRGGGYWRAAVRAEA